MHLPVVLVILKVAQKGVAKFSECQSMAWTAFLMLAALPSIWTEAGELLGQLSTTPLLPSAPGARGGPIHASASLKLLHWEQSWIPWHLSCYTGGSFGGREERSVCPSPCEQRSAQHRCVVCGGMLDLLCFSGQFLVWCVCRNWVWFSQLSNFSHPLGFRKPFDFCEV